MKSTAVLFLFLFTVLLSPAQQVLPVWKGTITYNYVGSAKRYDLATKGEKMLFEKAADPFVAANGDIYFVQDGFPKRGKLIRKSNAALIQFKDVLDMSGDNPTYKKALEEYSVIRRTGISSVLDRMATPKLSPDGKHLSVTVFGYQDHAFPNNCVAVFDVATGGLVTKFDNKYGGVWLADGRLLMAGSHKSVSTDGNEYHSKDPGIFITENGVNGLKRIDPDLSDPAPYHPAPSPDGKRVAFIINNHVWVMDMNGKNLKQLTDAGSDNIETFPTWSPDSKWIACWSYKTFEKSYFTALAIVPANAAKPVALTNTAPVWPRDSKKYRISGGSGQMSWK